MDRAEKGVLTATDFAASMAVMLSSSPEAAEGRYLLLFRMYDVFQGGTLERATLKRVLLIAYPDIESYELTGAVDEFFGNSSVLAYEEFSARLSACTISKRAVGELLTGWFYTICNHLMDEPEPELVALEQRYNPERGLRKVSVYWNDSNNFMNGLVVEEVDWTESSAAKALKFFFFSLISLLSTIHLSL